MIELIIKMFCKLLLWPSLFVMPFVWGYLVILISNLFGKSKFFTSLSKWLCFLSFIVLIYPALFALTDGLGGKGEEVHLVLFVMLMTSFLITFPIPAVTIVTVRIIHLVIKFIVNFIKNEITKFK